MLDRYDGGCFCGAVRYRFFGAPVLVAGCCCTVCAKTTGAPYTVWVGLFRTMIEFRRGAPRERETSPTATRGHCCDCGSALTFRRIRDEADRDPLFYVTATSLDDPDRVTPSEVVFYSERPTWFSLPPGIPRYPGASPNYGAPCRHGGIWH